MMKALGRTLILAALLAVLGAAADDEGTRTIATTIEQLRTALSALPRQSDQVDPARVAEVVENIVLPQVDVELAGQLVMGRYWRDASGAQRQAFIDAYRRLLLRLYAVHALDYLDAKVDFLSSQAADDGQRRRVSTRVHRAGKPDVTVDYQLRRRDGRLRVFDVVVDGVSAVITLRQAVGEDFQHYGIDGVIERLRTRLANNQAPSP